MNEITASDPLVAALLVNAAVRLLEEQSSVDIFTAADRADTTTVMGKNQLAIQRAMDLVHDAYSHSLIRLKSDFDEKT